MWVSQSFFVLLDFCGVILYGEIEDYLFWVVNLVEYCVLIGQSIFQEWIEGVQIGGLFNIFGNDGGYGNYIYVLYMVSFGLLLLIIFIFGYSVNLMVEFWSIWVDFNWDGIFNYDNELVY